METTKAIQDLITALEADKKTADARFTEIEKQLKQGSRGSGLTFEKGTPWVENGVTYTPTRIPDLGVTLIHSSAFPDVPVFRTDFDGRLGIWHGLGVKSVGHVHGLVKYIENGPGDPHQIHHNFGDGDISWDFTDAKGVKRRVAFKYIFSGSVPDKFHPDFKRFDPNSVVFISALVVAVDGALSGEMIWGHHDVVAKLREWQGL